MNPEELKRRLKAQQEARTRLSAQRATAAEERDQKQEAWAKSDNPDDPANPLFAEARDATQAVEALDEQVHEVENRERDILAMLAQRDPEAFEDLQRAEERPADVAGFDMARHIQSQVIAPNAAMLNGLSKGGAVQRVELGAIPRDVQAALLNTAGLGGAVPRDNRGIVQPLFEDPLVLQLINRGTTDSNLIEYWQVSYTRAAAPTAEGTTKPEASMSLTKEDAPVRTIPVWIPVTRQALSDMAGLQSQIEALLENDVEQEIDEQVVAGSGTGEALRGILNHSNIGHVYAGATGDLIRGIRRGVTRVRQSKGRANFVAINPEDWEEIVLTREDMTGGEPGTGQYLMGGPAQGTEASTIWRLRVVESDVIPVGSPLVGDGRGASLLVREDTTIALSEHDNVNFRQNLVTIRAEARVALPVWRAGFFAQVERADAPAP